MSGTGEKTVRFAGFGGQGIVKSGEIFGAAAILDGKSTLQNQAYGSSARGGLCTSDVTVSDGQIYDIEPDRFDILMILSQDSCDAFLHDVKPGGILIVEQDLVRLPEGLQGTVHAIPATRIATQDLGRRIVTNMVALGFLGAISGLVHRKSLERTIVANVPPGTDILNLAAFAEGWKRGETGQIPRSVLWF
jgi:2-oxoglutarate ferredoxin oxidoreductase subunit gamma